MQVAGLRTGVEIAGWLIFIDDGTAITPLDPVLRWLDTAEAWDELCGIAIGAGLTAAGSETC
jgi:hypothetical protein